MMKTLIVYSTKTGATKECADLLASKFENCVVCDLAKETPDIRPFEVVVVGSGVRFGRLYRPAAKFVKKNSSILKSKAFAFYLCNVKTCRLENIIMKDIPVHFIFKSRCIMAFGGKPPFKKLEGQEWMKQYYIDVLVRRIKAIENFGV